VGVGEGHKGRKRNTKRGGELRAIVTCSSHNWASTSACGTLSVVLRNAATISIRCTGPASDTKMYLFVGVEVRTCAQTGTKATAQMSVFIQLLRTKNHQSIERTHDKKEVRYQQVYRHHMHQHGYEGTGARVSCGRSWCSLGKSALRKFRSTT